MWDLEPVRNPESGLPASFLQMAIPDHIELWTLAPRRLLRQSRYAALLVSLHGTRLYDSRDLSPTAATRALDSCSEFLDGQRRLQHDLLESLRADPRTAASAAEPVVARNSGLIANVGHAVAGALPRLRALHRQACAFRWGAGTSSHSPRPTVQGG